MPKHNFLRCKTINQHEAYINFDNVTYIQCDPDGASRIWFFESKDSVHVIEPSFHELAKYLRDTYYGL